MFDQVGVTVQLFILKWRLVKAAGIAFPIQVDLSESECFSQRILVGMERHEGPQVQIQTERKPELRGAEHSIDDTLVRIEKRTLPLPLPYKMVDWDLLNQVAMGDWNL